MSIPGSLPSTILLQKYPAIGAAGGVGGSLFYWIDFLGPILSFIGVVLGVGIAAITFYLKVQEVRNKKKKKK